MTCPTCGFSIPPGATACPSCGTPLAPPAGPAHALPAGTKLAGGAYTVGKILGQGGFGITYLGSDTARAVPVAVKELFPAGCVRAGLAVRSAADWTLESYAEARQRFLEETKVLKRFHHPNIVRIFAAFEENDTAYMVMEYLRGGDLEALMTDRGGPLPEEEALGHIRQLGAALEVVHGAGLLHRDVKPDNAIVTDAGARTVLVDFGSAREFVAEKTRRMTAMLTPGYAPLEQYSQQARFGTFTDIYALAATLYHLLTAQVPVASLDRIQGVELPPPRQLNPQVSERVSLVVMKGMEMEVGRRPQSAREFLARLAPPAPLPRREAPAPRQPAPVNREPRRPPRRALRPELLFQLEGHLNWVNSVAFSPLGTVIASGGQDNRVLLWDARTGELLHELYGHTGPLMGMLGAIYSVCFSPHGDTVASGGNDDTVRLWDVASGRLSRTLVSRAGNVNAIQFSPLDRLLAVGTQFNRVELWDTAREDLLASLAGHDFSVVAVAFSPDGQSVVSGSEDGTAIVWDPRRAEAVARLGEHTGGIRSVAFSPDGRYLATGADDYTVHLWDMQLGTLERTLTGHGGGIRTVAFSPGGSLLASGGDDLTVVLWDVRTGRPAASLDGHAGSVTSVSFSPDGRLLATGSMDRTVQLWRLA